MENNLPQKEIKVTITRINPLWLRFVREGRALSLREVARRIGISPAYLSDIERGNGRYPNKKIVSFYEQLNKVKKGVTIA